VQRLGAAQQRNGHEVLYFSHYEASEHADATRLAVGTGRDLFDQAHAVGLDLLHLHRPAPMLPPDRVPTVRTMHGNQGSCPSGSRYLKRTGQPCNRRFTVGGCLWGHVVDHCGSRRPQKTLANFQNIRREQQQAAELPTITVSQFLKEQMIRSGCTPDNLHVIHSPAPEVETDFTPLPMNTPPRFLFAGRIEPKKGLDWLLRAAARVTVPMHLDVAGSGSEDALARMHSLVADLGIEDRVTFHGWLDGDEVLERMRNARVIVFPSVWHEPAGLITLEAAAMGRPVIASAVGGISEYALDGFALLVPVRDLDALANAIHRLARSPHEAEAMGQRALHMARTRFSMERFLNQLHMRYEAALSSARSSVSK
jgi:glycosyltransferase involved in cell wall biosynthesis